LFLESLYMDMRPAPPWDEMLSLSTLTPIYEEEILYPLGDLTRVENTGYSVLNRLVVKFPDEWWNFVEALRQDGLLTPEAGARLARAASATEVAAAVAFATRPGPDCR